MSLTMNEAVLDAVPHAAPRMQQIGDYATGSMIIDTETGTALPDPLSRSMIVSGESVAIFAVLTVLFFGMMTLLVPHWLWNEIRAFVSLTYFGGSGIAVLLMHRQIPDHEKPTFRLF